MRSIDLRIDVTEAVALGEQIETAVTVTLPDELPDRPVVCFAWPGGGYSRGYFTFDMPGTPSGGQAGGGQAGGHASRGWIFVSCDHVDVADSTHPSDPTTLTYDNLAAANRATVDAVLAKLGDGSLADAVPAVPAVTAGLVIGIGQSMGGCLLIVQQGQHRTFDGIGVLGYSASHTVLWMPPGTPKAHGFYVPRGSRAVIVSADDAETALGMDAGSAGELPATTPGFHFDDVPRDIVTADMVEYPTRRGNVPEWGSGTIPPCAITMMAPGVVAPEAAVITAPVFVGVGERDVCPVPLSEPMAYPRATDVTVYVCPRMSHMHNFASTRERFWARLAAWADALDPAAR